MYTPSMRAMLQAMHAHHACTLRMHIAHANHVCRARVQVDRVHPACTLRGIRIIRHGPHRSYERYGKYVADDWHVAHEPLAAGSKRVGSANPGARTATVPNRDRRCESEYRDANSSIGFVTRAIGKKSPKRLRNPNPSTQIPTIAQP